MDTEKFAAYQRDREHRRAIRAFYITLSVYVIVNVALFVIDMLTPGGPWFFWPLLGWGIGMIFFGLSAFVWSDPKNRDLAEEQRMREIFGQKPPEQTG